MIKGRVVMENNSMWAGTANKTKAYPTLKGDQVCDTVIIGGGYSGLSTAYHLQKENCKTIILEKNKMASGASGRNGGHVLTGFGPSMSSIIKKRGLDQARVMMQMSLDSIDLIKSIINEHEISCDFHQSGHMTAAYKPAHLDVLKREQEVMFRDFDYEISIIEKDELHTEMKTSFYHGGSVDENSAIFHPLNYALGLAEVVEKLGGKLYEHSEAIRIEKDEKGKVIVTTAGGRVIADQIVIVTNAYSGDLHKLIGKSVIPTESIMIATESLQPGILEGLIKNNRAVFDTKNLLYYFRRTDDNRMAFGGAGRISANSSLQNAFNQLELGMGNVFPELKAAKIEYKWSGKVGITPERIPCMGQLTDGTHFAFGYAGHGAAMSTLMGKLIAKNVMGVNEGKNPLEKEKLKPIPFYNQHAKGVSMVKYYYKITDKLF